MVFIAQTPKHMLIEIKLECVPANFCIFGHQITNYEKTDLPFSPSANALKCTKRM